MPFTKNIVPLLLKNSESTHARQKKKSFSLFCARLIVPLLLKNSESTHARQKKEKFFFVLRSLNCTFAFSKQV